MPSSPTSVGGIGYLRPALACVVLTGVSYLWLDGPAATWSHAAFAGVAFWRQLALVGDGMVPGAMLCLVVGGIAAASGWRPRNGGRLVLLLSVSVLLAQACNEEIRYGAGRTWPETWTHQNPSWIANGVKGFHPFHGGEGWKSFPSGHLARLGAALVVLWRLAPRSRWAAGVACALVAFSVYASNYHFVSDMIAGGFVGAACAAGVLGLCGA